MRMTCGCVFTGFEANLKCNAHVIRTKKSAGSVLSVPARRCCQVGVCTHDLQKSSTSMSSPALHTGGLPGTLLFAQASDASPVLL